MGDRLDTDIEGAQNAGLDIPAGGPWPADSAGKEPAYRLPFLFSANGRGYLKQIETQSGIWFRDARAPTKNRYP